MKSSPKRGKRGKEERRGGAAGVQLGRGRGRHGGSRRGVGLLLHAERVFCSCILCLLCVREKKRRKERRKEKEGKENKKYGKFSKLEIF
jgi:hypothetical protein